MKAGLRAYLKNRPWAYQNEMQLYFYDDWGIVVNQSTVSRLLKSMDISRKILKRIAAERDQNCRNKYHFQMANYSADMLVYVDEYQLELLSYLYNDTLFKPIRSRYLH